MTREAAAEALAREVLDFIVQEVGERLPGMELQAQAFAGRLLAAMERGDIPGLGVLPESETLTKDPMVLLAEKCTERNCGTRVRYGELTDDANTHWHVRKGVALVPASCARPALADAAPIGCGCSCHRMPGVSHVAPCCNAASVTLAADRESGEFCEHGYASAHETPLLASDMPDGSTRHAGWTTCPGPTSDADREPDVPRAKVRGVFRTHRVKSEASGDQLQVITYRCTGCDYTFVRDLSADEPSIDWLTDHVADVIAALLAHPATDQEADQ